MTPGVGSVDSFDKSGEALVEFGSGINISDGSVGFSSPKILVNLKRSLEDLDFDRGTKYSDNLLLSVPFDGEVGIVNGEFDRVGYGTDFSFENPGVNVFNCPFTDDVDSFIFRQSSGGSNALVKAKFSLRQDLSSTAGGNVFSVRKASSGNDFEIVCSPSAPVHLIAFPAGDVGDTVTDLFYGYLDKSRDDFEGLNFYDSLNGLADWKNEEGEIVGDSLNQYQPADFCSGWNDSRYLANLSNGKWGVYDTTIYAPLGSSLSAACSNVDTIFAASFLDNANTSGELASVTTQYRTPVEGSSESSALLVGRYSVNDTPGQRSNFFNPSITSFAGQISKENVCVFADGKSVGLKWNPDAVRVSVADIIEMSK